MQIVGKQVGINLPNLDLYKRSSKHWLPNGPDHDRVWQQVVHLSYGTIQEWSHTLLCPFIPDVAGDSNHLDSLSVFTAKGSAHRVFIRPQPLCHSFINDSDFR